MGSLLRTVMELGIQKAVVNAVPSSTSYEIEYSGQHSAGQNGSTPTSKFSIWVNRITLLIIYLIISFYCLKILYMHTISNK